tara:strand:+ start:22 stop:624 length:603 start_codon:yes stop_codon:yes gene_type:complete
VFVVGCFGDWRSAASVLLEPESMSGNPPPSREAGQRVAPTVTVGPPFSRTGNSRVETEALVTYALPGNWIGRKPENGGNQVEPFVDLSPCQTATDVHAVVASRMRGFGDYTQDGTASTVKARDDKDATDLVAGSTVRRMTPKECERLQGFPDDYSRIAWRNKEPEDCPNGHRYKALGNSMAVPVMNWIGRRIDMVEKGEL